jgi:DNA-directed RNA polymerase subunit RPC12/RpoP
MDNDTISRQAAIDAVRNYLVGKNVSCDGTLTCRLIENEVISKLPSTQPEPKTAHWIPLDERFASWSDYFKCSECGFRINLRTAKDFGILSVDYCPHCGAKMEVKNET